MKQFDELWDVATKLHGPDGCPWDRRQTFFSLQPFVLEEAHEVVEAVDRGSDAEVLEELGDLLYTVIFYAKIAQKESRFSMEQILETIKAKLIRRHPHVFEDLKVESEEEIAQNWERIKREEGKEQKHPGGGLSEKLPTLVKAQKIVRNLCRSGKLTLKDQPKAKEEEIAQELFAILQKAEASEVDAESALRRILLSPCFEEGRR